MSMNAPTPSIAGWLEKGFKSINAASGVKQSVAALQRLWNEAPTHLHQQVLHDVLDLTYNRYINFGISLTWAELREIWERAGADRVPMDISIEHLDHLRQLSQMRGGSRASRLAKISEAVAGLREVSLTIIYTILERDLRINIGESTINKAIPGMLPTFSVMLAHKFEGKRVKKWPLAAEPKFDGMRVVAQVLNGDVTFHSRNGNSVPAAVSFTNRALELAKVLVELNSGRTSDWLLDSEVIAGENFNDSISAARKDAPMESGTLMVFDAIPLPEFINNGASTKTYRERRAMLADAFRALENFDSEDLPLRIRLADSYVVHNEAEITQLFNAALNSGLEGLVVKNPDGRWVNKRSHDWMKIKAEETLDLTVIGAFEGTGQFEGSLGGLIVDHQGVQVEVGSGFTPDERASIWRDYQHDLRTRAAANDDEAYLSGRILGKVIEVKFHEVTPAGSLRHPVFKVIREDKSPVNTASF